MAVWRVVLSGTVFGQLNQNRVHLVENTPGTTAAILAEDFRVHWVLPLRGLLMTQFVFNLIQVYNLSDPATAPYTLVVNLPGTGGSVVGGVLQQALVYKFATAVAGRRGRGRFFLGGTGNNVTENGTLSGSNYSYYNNQWDSIRSYFLQGAAGAGPYALGLITGNDPSTFRSVISIALSPFPGTQRRRRVGVGV